MKNLLLPAIFLMSCTTAPDTNDPEAEKAHLLNVARKFYDVINTRNVDSILQMYSPRLITTRG
jgi:hypothetical protein